MSIENWPGGVISKTPPTPSGPYETSTAPGVWTLRQATDYIKQGNWPTAGISATDPYFEYVTMLLHGDGTNGGQNNTFLDSSTNNLSITRNGNTTQGSFSPYGTLWSNYFDGNGDYFTVPNNAAFTFGTGDFTVEAWVFLTSLASNTCLVGGNQYQSFDIQLCVDGNKISVGRTNFSYDFQTTYTFQVGQWTHVAISRASGTIRCFVNGSLLGSASNTTSYSQAGGVTTIGASNAAEHFINGYISNLRIVNGTAVYTSAFTPSTTPLTAVSGTSLLTCADNRFIDDSTNNFTLTRNGNISVQRFSPFSPSSEYSAATIGGSGYFDGTSDYLSIANSSATGLGSGNFTVESWINLSAVPSATPYAIIANGERYYRLYVNSGSLQFWWRISGSDYSLTSSAITWATNTWYHVAVVRNSSTIRIYLNGVSVGSTTSGTTGTIENIGAIGVGAIRADSTPTWFFNGYISDTRVLVGTAQYTAAFTPPSTPLTAITNTSLLISYTNGAIFDNAMMNDLETVGNAQISTSVKKFGTGSLAFDGTGDWLYGPSTPNVGLGTGAFTVEMWVYPTSNTGNGPGTLFDARSGANAEGWVLRVFSDLSVGFYNGPSNVYQQTSANAVPLNTWTYVAFVRSGTTLTIYVNGTSASTSTVSSDLGASWPFYIGNNYSAGYTFTGYIDELRLTKGYARYTTNFATPVRAFQNN